MVTRPTSLPGGLISSASNLGNQVLNFLITMEKGVVGPGCLLHFLLDHTCLKLRQVPRHTELCSLCVHGAHVCTALHHCSYPSPVRHRACAFSLHLTHPQLWLLPSLSSPTLFLAFLFPPSPSLPSPPSSLRLPLSPAPSLSSTFTSGLLSMFAPPPQCLPISQPIENGPTLRILSHSALS